MTVFATLNDLLEQEPNLQDYGLLDWSQELQSATEEVIRHIRVRWWPLYRGQSVENIVVTSPATYMDETLLDPTQWTKATVYYCIAHQVCPKLTKFEASGDRFQIMMDYYAKRYETEFDIVLREGVRYDADNDNVYTNQEKQSTGDLRLKR